MTVYQPGQRVALVHTTDLSTDLRPGNTGTVRRYHPSRNTVDVDWDSGSRLSMCLDDGDRITSLDPAATDDPESFPDTRPAALPVDPAQTGSPAPDGRFRRDDPAANLGDLIVDAVPRCLTPVRAMIDAHDRYFGAGSGEEFFMSVYLDALPNAVIKAIGKNAE